jgi:integration host factor subunit alpha
MALTKANIIDAIQKDIGLPKRDCSELMENLIETMKKALEKNDHILISGFGKFSVNEKNARRGRNPSSGEDMILKKRRVVTFKCSGKLREKINNHFKSKNNKT